MSKPNFQKIFKNVKSGLSRHSPEILTGIGLAGMITTSVLAVRATPKAIRLIEDAKEEKQEDLKPIEIVKVAWKPYIPAMVTCVVSASCIIGASSVNARRNAAIATAYKLSETALTEYKEKVIETIGEKKEKTIREQIDKDHIEKNPASKNQIIMTGRGETLCYDTLSGRYFKSDLEQIKRIRNDLNARLISEMYISLNEFYDELGLDHTILGDDLGWNMDDGLLELDFSTQLSDDGRPCIVINYTPAPKYDYYKIQK